MNISTSYILAGICLIATSCLLPKSLPEYVKKNVLPGITQHGANTAGCLIDGKVHLPNSGGYTIINIGSMPYFRCDYNNFSGEYDFTLYFQDREKKTDILISMISPTPLKEGMTYGIGHLSGRTYVGTGFGEIEAEKRFRATEGLPFNITFTKIDPIKKIIAGTFAFEALENTRDKDADTIRVTQGRFDITYPYYDG